MLNDENATIIYFKCSFYKRVSLQADMGVCCAPKRGIISTPTDLWLEISVSHSSPGNSENK